MLSFRPSRVFAVTLLAALLGALLPVHAAHAENRTVQEAGWTGASRRRSRATSPGP
ncbi:hypothetical protein ACFQ60_17200 [Streptomyces zhihengii]